MDFKDLAIQTEENTLAFLSHPQFRDEIEYARKYFYDKLADANIEEMTLDFNAWLMYDYKMKDHKTVFQKYFDTIKDNLSEKEIAYIQKQMASFLSLYQLKEIKGNQGLFQDIFRKVEFWIELDDLEEMRVKDLVLTRIIQIVNKYQFFGEKICISAMFKSTIERNMLEQYEIYKAKNRYGTWENFLKDDSILLYKYIGIILDVTTHELEEESTYNVWQSIYLVKEAKIIKENLLKHKSIKLDFEENQMGYFKLFDERYILAEIVLTPHRMEVECTSEQERDRAKEMIQLILGDLVKYYGDEVITIDDIV
ncbi:hypothetical protein QBE52_07865 [Clostridiaceae bacterium 35-E11]